MLSLSSAERRQLLRSVLCFLELRYPPSTCNTTESANKFQRPIDPWAHSPNNVELRSAADDVQNALETVIGKKCVTKSRYKIQNSQTGLQPQPSSIREKAWLFLEECVQSHVIAWRGVQDVPSPSAGGLKQFNYDEVAYDNFCRGPGEKERTAVKELTISAGIVAMHEGVLPSPQPMHNRKERSQTAHVANDNRRRENAEQNARAKMQETNDDTLESTDLASEDEEFLPPRMKQDGDISETDNALTVETSLEPERSAIHWATTNDKPSSFDKFMAVRANSSVVWSNVPKHRNVVNPNIFVIKPTLGEAAKHTGLDAHSSRTVETQLTNHAVGTQPNVVSSTGHSSCVGDTADDDELDVYDGPFIIPWTPINKF
ncbi:MAG: hypothetical protein LQ340_002542 [Diploschistes diacapsis]|nr:MAG: hypothetical protein LQ340_002542 [Diploschistes diacapsis]